MLAAFFSRTSDGNAYLRTARSLTRGAICVALLYLLCSGYAAAQGSGQDITGRPADIDVATETPTGSTFAGYTVQQSIEFGGRIQDRTGNGGMYNTLVNLQSGPRLLDQSLIIRPMANTKGSFFDSLYLQSFGWGGDPSNAARLRVSKHALYDFRASFRRDQNYFDYDLLANPLNPTSTNPTLPTIFIDNSPHLYNLRRRMYDFSLVLLPQRTFSFRIDYSRNRNEGPSFSTLHIGTEALLDQAWSTTNDILRLGMSWRATQRTTLSFTESLQWMKNDTDYTLAPAILVPSSAGYDVNYGISWLGGSPCATPIIGGLANPACNGYLSYNRAQRFRNFLPTEQVNLTSKELRRVDLNARFMYSTADTNTPRIENFDGLESRTGVRNYNFNGTAAHATWVSDEADAGLTVRIMPHLRFVDTFRFYAYRIPGELYLFENNFFNLGTTGPNILQPIAAAGQVPFHNASSPADSLNDFYHRFVQQRTKSNEAQLQLDISRFFGVRAGFLYKNIFDSHDWVSTAIADMYLPDATGASTTTCLGLGGTVSATTGICTFSGEFDSEVERFPSINQYWAIAGLWFRSGEKFRVDAEGRYMSADDFLTRIDPRKEQQYRANASYTPRGWLTVAANVNIREQRNRTQDFGYNAHYRNFGFNVIAAQSKRIAVDAAYNYSNASQNNNACYTGSIVAPGSVACVNDPALLETLAFYWNKTHYGSANLMVRPVSRVSAVLGYSIIDTDGNTLILNARQPLGSLSFRYHEPLASLAVGVTKQVELRAGWNYYQYNENSFAGPTLPRYFHANLVTLSARYAL